MRICQETFYQYLFVLPRGELKKGLLKTLRQKPRYRHKRMVQRIGRFFLQQRALRVKLRM